MICLTIVFLSNFPFIDFKLSHGKDWVYGYAIRKPDVSPDFIIEKFSEEVRGVK